MQIVGIVPARLGSKRIPGKNIRELCGKPLLFYTLEEALKSRYLTAVYVTTESPVIREKVREFNSLHSAEVGVIERPPELAQDLSTTEETLIHAVRELSRWGLPLDYLMLLPPTSPFRTAQHMDSLVERVIAQGASSGQTVSAVKIRVGEVTSDFQYRYVPGFETIRMDQLRTSFVENSAAYLLKPAILLDSGTLQGPSHVAMVLDKPNDLDINDLTDWAVAEALLEKGIIRQESARSCGSTPQSDYLSGLSTVNVELSNRCNKSCWMCGRRRIEREFPDLALQYGDMDFELIQTIAGQLPAGIVVQLHNNGESLLHPRFGEAVPLFNRQTTCLNTNGKLLVEKAGAIIDNLDSITVSIIENDPEAEEQYRIVKEFLKLKGDRRPIVTYRCLGNVDTAKWKDLPGIVATRVLHHALGSYQYRRPATIPEIGICLDMLHHMAIDKDGNVSICVRLDPRRLGVIGNARQTPLHELWRSELRREWLELHRTGRRAEVPLCQTCDFWGVPTSS